MVTVDARLGKNERMNFSSEKNISPDPPPNNWQWIENEVIDELLALRPSACRLYLALLRRCDKYRQCFPGGEDLATRSGMARRTIWRELKILKDAGLIRIDRGSRKRRSNLYTLLPLKSDDSKATINKANQMEGDTATTGIVAQEQLGIVAQEQREEDTGEVEVSEESKSLSLYFKKNNARFYHHIRQARLKIRQPEETEIQTIYKVAALVVLGEISQSDFQDALEFDAKKTETTPTRHFLGLLRKRTRAAGKNIDRLMEGVTIPPELLRDFGSKK